MSAKEESRTEARQQSSPCPSNATAKVIFTYAIEHLSKTDKVRFYYALKGRDGKSGVVVQWSIEQLGRAVLLVPESHENDVRDFLSFWKCTFNSRRVWIV